MLEGVRVYNSLEELIGYSDRTWIYLYIDRYQGLEEVEKIVQKYPNVVICSEFFKNGSEDNSQYNKRWRQIEKINHFTDHVIQERIYDVKQVLKLARSHRFKLNLGEQVEAICIQMK